MGHTVVSVTCTPTGRSDALMYDCMVRGERRTMCMNDFLDRIEGKEDKKEYGKWEEKEVETVYYLSEQNASFEKEFGEMSEDVQVLDWANEALGIPDAVNIWIGDDNSVSSLHNDPYENIYCCVKGSKEFLLIPPTDKCFLEENEYLNADYVFENNTWKIVPDKNGSTTPWINYFDNDPSCKANAIVCTLNAGDVLYLPALWYHQVSQKKLNDESTVAINFWYDMHYGFYYSYYQFMSQVIKLDRFLLTENSDINDEEKDHQ